MSKQAQLPQQEQLPHHPGALPDKAPLPRQAQLHDNVPLSRQEHLYDNVPLPRQEHLYDNLATASPGAKCSSLPHQILLVRLDSLLKSQLNFKIYCDTQ